MTISSPIVSNDPDKNRQRVLDAWARNRIAYGDAGYRPLSTRCVAAGTYNLAQLNLAVRHAAHERATR